jgi:hypothetical protein
MQSVLHRDIHWPIKDHLRDAIRILEVWHDAGYAVEALPVECQDERWSWAAAPGDTLRRLAIEQKRPGAVLGFPGSPGALALRWLFEQAGLGFTSWDELELTDRAFAKLTAAAGVLGASRVLFDPGPWPTADAVYARARRTIREFGVAWVAIFEQSVSDGLPLSLAPRPWGWLEEVGFEESQLLIVES